MPKKSISVSKVMVAGLEIRMLEPLFAFLGRCAPSSPIATGGMFASLTAKSLIRCQRAMWLKWNCCAQAKFV